MNFLPKHELKLNGDELLKIAYGDVNEWQLLMRKGGSGVSQSFSDAYIFYDLYVDCQYLPYRI